MAKVVYIAGPYRSPLGEHQVLTNIMHARDAALFVWRNGGVAICPHLNTFLFGGAFGLPDKTWLDGDLEIISRCDAIFMVSGWEGSDGSKKELEWAGNCGLTKLFTYEQVIEFLSGGGIK